MAREQQILQAMTSSSEGIGVPGIVEIVYASYPKTLHLAAGQSVTAHLLKLEREGRVRRVSEEEPVSARWVRLAEIAS